MRSPAKTRSPSPKIRARTHLWPEISIGGRGGGTGTSRGGDGVRFFGGGDGVAAGRTTGIETRGSSNWSGEAILRGGGCGLGFGAGAGAGAGGSGRARGAGAGAGAGAGDSNRGLRGSRTWRSGSGTGTRTGGSLVGGVGGGGGVFAFLGGVLGRAGFTAFAGLGGCCLFCFGALRGSGAGAALGFGLYATGAVFGRSGMGGLIGSSWSRYLAGISGGGGIGPGRAAVTVRRAVVEGETEIQNGI